MGKLHPSGSKLALSGYTRRQGGRSSHQLVLGDCGDFVVSDDVGEGSSGLLRLWVVEDDQPDEYEDSCRERKTNTQQQQQEMVGSVLLGCCQHSSAASSGFPQLAPAPAGGSPQASGDPFGWDMPWVDNVPVPLLRNGFLGGKPPPLEWTWLGAMTSPTPVAGTSCLTCPAKGKGMTVLGRC